MGIRFALDDFGAGFASFYYLKHLEFDFVKIDGEFIKGLAHNTTDQLVIRSVVDLARGLGAQTIAEFVGDEESVRRLHELGVDYGQGYHLGRPQPIAEILPISATFKR
jgi:EAL domain-containing protein (putative c-di-GMP-specific phosphodiesterase class I)